MTPVPQFDFINPNFVNLVAPEGNYFNYEGPSQLVQRIASATAAQGEILPITPPALNASWSLEFWGPSVHCNNVSDSQRTAVRTTTDYTYKPTMSDTLPLSYFSWAVDESMLPFYSDSGTMMLNSNALSLLEPAAVFMAFDSDYELLPDGIMRNYSNASIQAYGGWSHILRNMTILRCDLFNSSYALDFQYTNGAQNIVVSKADTSQDTPIAAEANFYFPTGPHETWNATQCNQLDYPAPICFQQSEAKKASYQGIKDAFNMLLRGSIIMQSEVSDSFITQTVLTDTDELQFLSNQPAVSTTLGNSPAFQSRPTKPLLRSRGRLIDALERLFENITISMLSEPYLQ